MNSRDVVEREVYSTCYKLLTSINEANKSYFTINQHRLEYVVLKLLKNSEYPMSKSQIINKFYSLNELDDKKLDIILSYYNFIHCNDYGYFYSEEEKTFENNLMDILVKLKYLNMIDDFTLVYNLFKSIGRPLKEDEIKNYINIVRIIDEEKLVRLIKDSTKFISTGHKTYALADWAKYKKSYIVPEEKTFSIHDKLYTSILKSIKSLRIVNQCKPEYLVYKLLKNSRYSMTIYQILDQLYFLKKIDIKELDLILSYYEFIHYNDNFGYFYSKEEKTIENNFFDIVKKLNYLESIDMETYIYNLFISIGQPMHIDEIENYISIIINIDKEELKNILEGSRKFKIIKYKTYALVEWDQYEELFYDFENDISLLTSKIRNSKRNWDIYKKYVFSSQRFTLEDIGSLYNITRERVRQIVKKIEKSLSYSSYKNRFDKYIDFVENLIYDYGVLNLTYSRHIEELRRVFGDRNLIDTINFLNKLCDKFIVLDDKYCYLKERYDYLINYINYLVEKTGESYVSLKNFDSMCFELNIVKWREKELLRAIIDKDERFYVNKGKGVCYYSKEKFDKYCLIWTIFDDIGEPVHYSHVMNRYNQIKGDNVNSHLFLSYLDRRKDLFVRVFTGTYALKKWGYSEHVFSTDLVVEILESKKAAMHYRDIYDCIKDKTMAKRQTVYTLMQSDDRIVALGCGYYCLKSYIENNSGNVEYYSNIVDSDNKRRLGYILAKFDNKYDNTVIKFRVIESMLNSYSMKIPKIFNIELDDIVYLFDNYHNRYSCKFDRNYNDLYGINKYFKIKEIIEGDILYLEIISKNTIRLFTEYEYEYAYKAFDKDEYSEYVEIEEIKDEDNTIEIVDLDSLIKFGLKKGFVYYEDLEEIDISDKYDDIYELMIDFSERGINFLNKG